MTEQDKDNPVVSIGLMTYNRAHYLPSVIDSWLAQTFQNFELIISDDVSSDETQAICEAYARKDARIRYIRQEKNLNQPLCFKVVLGYARGEYFIWATDDDLWDPKFLEDCVGLHRTHPELVMVFPGMVDIDGHGRVFKHLDPAKYMPLRPNSYERLKEFMAFYFNDGRNQLILGLWKRTVILDDPLFGPNARDDQPPYYWGFENYFVFRNLAKGPVGFVPQIRFFRRSRVLEEYRPPRPFLLRFLVSAYHRFERICTTPYFYYIARHILRIPGLTSIQKVKLFGWNVVMMMRILFVRKI